MERKTHSSIGLSVSLASLVTIFALGITYVGRPVNRDDYFSRDFKRDSNIYSVRPDDSHGSRDLTAVSFGSNLSVKVEGADSNGVNAKSKDYFPVDEPPQVIGE